MQIINIKKPFEVSFSGNPIAFVFGIGPYGAVEKAMNLRVVIGILIEQEYGSGVYEEVKSQVFFPDADGLVSFDCSSILDAYLEFYTPTVITPAVASRALNQYKRYKISYQVNKDTVAVLAAVQTVAQLVIKGGLSYQEWHQSEFFEKVIVHDRNFLNFEAKGEVVRMEEMRYLFFTCPVDASNVSDPNAKLETRYTVYLSDGTTVSDTVPYTWANMWEVICVPAGFIQCQLDLLVPAGKYAVKYSVAVWRHGDIKSAAGDYTYSLDYRQFYKTHSLLYRNSTGGIESITMRGQVDYEAEYSREMVTRTLSPYHTEGGLAPQTVQQYAEETEKLKGDTGFISKDAMMKLRDLLLVNQVWEVVTDPAGIIRLYPVVVNTKAAKFYTNKDNLLSLQVDWDRAYSNQYYTPNGLMPTARTCPAVERLTVVQQGKESIQVSYSLQMPYNLALVTVTVVATGAATTYRYVGNIKTVEIATPVPVGVTLPMSLTVDVVTVCDEVNGDIGPVMSQSVSIANRLPVALDNTFEVAAGGSGWMLIGNVLDNDYDPDGDTIETLPLWNQPTTGLGGIITLDNEGNVFFYPSSPGFTGSTWFTYLLRNTMEPNPLNWKTATATILVGTGRVYVQLVIANPVTTTESTTSTEPIEITRTTAEAWLYFFSDLAGTIPLDVTGKGLQVNVNKTLAETRFGGSLPTLLPTITTELLVDAAGTSTLIENFNSSFIVKDTNTPQNTVLTKNTSFLVMVGTGYVGI